MKRVAITRLALTLLFALIIVIASHAPANATDRPMEFMTTHASGMAFNATMGDYDFTLVNRTTGWVLNGFYTQENGKWSKNWLSTKLGVGKSVQMMWSAASDKGECVVPFKTTWDDYDKAEIYKLDWCKGIKTVYLKDETFTVEYK